MSKYSEIKHIYEYNLNEMNYSCYYYRGFFDLKFKILRKSFIVWFLIFQKLNSVVDSIIIIGISLRIVFQKKKNCQWL